MHVYRCFDPGTNVHTQSTTMSSPLSMPTPEMQGHLAETSQKTVITSCSSSSSARATYLGNKLVLPRQIYIFYTNFCQS